MSGYPTNQELAESGLLIPVQYETVPQFIRRDVCGIDSDNGDGRYREPRKRIPAIERWVQQT